MIASLFRRPTNRWHATPQPQPATVPVNVTATLREAPNDALEFVVDEQMADHIRRNQPNAKPISTNLRAARAARTLKQEAAFLADTSGTVPPPEREALIDALQFAAGFIFDRIVIA